MSDLLVPTDHEYVQIKSGRRSGLPIMIAVHSTLLGPAIGGLRIKHYAHAADGIADVLRLSQAMTMKAAAIDNGSGGGKTVVPLPTGFAPSPAAKEAILLDVADHVHALNGDYHVAPDVGTGPTDIDVIRRRTPYAGGYSREAGGEGGTTYGTYIGVDTALRLAVRHTLNTESVAGLTIGIIGLGGIGTRLARDYAREGARLVVADIDPSRKACADEIGATWVTPEEALLCRSDVLVPCALGGVFTAGIVGHLNTKVICGAANNQLESDHVAQLLTDRGIVYVPDFIANADGLMHASGIRLHHRSEAASERHTREGIARNTALVLDQAKASSITTNEAALQIARQRLSLAALNLGRSAASGPA